MMEFELKDLNSKPSESQHSEPAHDEGTVKDDRPLLRSDSNSASQQNLEELEKKYAAFVRRDVYGPMGRGKLPLKEKVLLGGALLILVPLRLAAAISILVLYYMICRFCTLFSIPYREDDEQEDYAHLGGWRRIVIVQTGRLLSRAILFVFGVYWIHETRISHNQENSIVQKENNNESQELDKPGAIISNHVSYLDILYHMSSSFPSFVAKRSVEKLPLVGIISKCLGCVFVQRESKSADFKGVSGVVSERVREANQNSHAPLMMLFPEGTTTNGEYLLPFKSGAFLAKAPVLPVILKYPYQRFSLAWDSISGMRHVIFLLCQFVNHMEVIKLPAYYPTQQEKDEPRLYANNVRRLMATEGNLILSDIGLAEKRIYHAALNGNNSLPTVLHQKDD